MVTYSRTAEHSRDVDAVEAAADNNKEAGAVQEQLKEATADRWAVEMPERQYQKVQITHQKGFVTYISSLENQHIIA